MANADRQELEALADRLDKFLDVLKSAHNNKTNKSVSVWTDDVLIVQRAVQALRTTSPAADREEVAADQRAQRIQELHEIADGATGEGPFRRGKARELLNKMLAEDSDVRATTPGAVAEPSAYTNSAQLGFLKDPAYAEIPMAMWAGRGVASDIPLYTHPAPSDGAIREALQRLEDACERLAASRTNEIYTAMIDGGQQNDLLELDGARIQARAALTVQSPATGDKG